MIAADGRNFALPNHIDTLIGIGVIPDNIPEAHNAVDAYSVDFLKHRCEGLEIGMYVR